MINHKNTKQIVFCNIGWCTNYIGDEELIGGGSHVDENGEGNESVNFLPIIVSDEDCDEGKTMLLGSFETKHTKGAQNQTHIERIRGFKGLNKDLSAEGVIVVWCAKNPEGETCVVGWYKNATVCRYYEALPIDDEDGNTWDRLYNVFALYEDATLLPAEIRAQPQWSVPRHSMNNHIPFGFGQANIWYASEQASEDFVNRIIYQIENYYGEDIKIKL